MAYRQISRHVQHGKRGERKWNLKVEIKSNLYPHTSMVYNQKNLWRCSFPHFGHDVTIIACMYYHCRDMPWNFNFLFLFCSLIVAAAMKSYYLKYFLAPLWSTMCIVKYLKNNTTDMMKSFKCLYISRYTHIFLLLFINKKYKWSCWNTCDWDGIGMR